MKSYISLKNWGEFQHYKSRTPPWIKLHNSLIENYEFESLLDASKSHLIGIMLLASRTENKINADPLWIGRRIGATEPVNLQCLIDSGFIELNGELQEEEHVASTLQQQPEHNAIERRGEESRGEESRGEREESRERAEENKKISVIKKPKIQTLNVNGSEYTKPDVFKILWDMYEHKGSESESLKKFNLLTIKEIHKAIEHIPKYVKSTPTIKYRKGFQSYLNKKTFNDLIIESNDESIISSVSQQNAINLGDF